MAALVCDICGGKLVMGAGGIATCESCGMEHSQDRMKEKIQEIKGVVRVDNSHMVDNWMKMGAAAASAGNHKEAYEYFTKVIEIDPENWRAIYEKGKAGAWQSTLGNLRTSEIYQGIQMALDIIKRSNMSEEELKDVKNEFAVALFNFNNAITDLMSENLFNLDDKYFDSHWDMMWNTRQRHITNVDQLEDALSLIADLDDALSKSNVVEFKKRMCDDLKAACESIQYWTDYSQTSLGYLGFKPEEKKKHLDKFWNLVDEIREVEPDYRTEKWSYPDPFGPGFHGSDEIYRYWQKADAERKARKEKELWECRIREYWETHSEEKVALEQRLTTIKGEKAQIQSTLSDFNDKTQKIQKEQENQFADVSIELVDLKAQISSLETQKGKLGLFAGKQKKEIQAQIDSLKAILPNIEEKVARAKAAIKSDIDAKLAQINAEKKPFSDRLAALTNEENNINVELTKQR